MFIDLNTIKFALGMLDDAYEQIWRRRVGKQRESQSSYYHGMKEMFETIISNIYKLDIHIDVNESGRHSIREKIMEEKE